MKVNQETGQFPLSGFNEARDGFITRFANKNLVGKTVLELGCGDGERTELFYNASQVIGIDIVNRVDDARKQKFSFLLADATHLPFRDNSFDAVVSFDVIEHVENDKMFVSEAFRTCKTGGDTIIGTPNRLRLSNRLRRLVGKKVEYPCTIGPGVIHLREYTAEEYISIVQSAGFLGECKYIWLGIVSRFNMGLRKVPGFLNPFVQYLIFLGRKP